MSRRSTGTGLGHEGVVIKGIDTSESYEVPIVDKEGYLFTKMTVANNSSLDQFNRLRVSTPHSLFDYQLQYNAQPLLWESNLTGSGTATTLPNESAVRLRCTTASGDKVVRQTKQYVRYQPGKSQLILLTGVMGPSKANVRKRLGYFDVDNGIFFEQTGTAVNVVRRTKASGTVVDNVVAQADWNIDKLDGTTDTGIGLDIEKIQVFIIDFEWLGAGRVRLGFVINGIYNYCHEFLNANVLSTVYMTTANLPLRYEIENTAATASNTDLIQVCTGVISEGGYEPLGLVFSANSGTTGISVTTRRAILTIRLQSTFNSITNRGTVAPELFEIYTKTQDVLYEVIYNGTLGGTPSWTSVSANSLIEYDVAGTTVTGGEVITSGYVAAGTGNVGGVVGKALLSKLPLTLDVAGTTSDTLTIVATSLSTAATVYGSLTWKEFY